MKLEEHVPLSELTTLRVGGNARYVAYCNNESDIREAVEQARLRNLSFVVLGSGSNVLASDAGYGGMVIRPLLDELVFEEQEAGVLVTAGAHVLWDDLVRAAAERHLWGIENLAGIPGTVGAAPVQNIGAYGTELSDTLVFVDAYDTMLAGTIRFSAEECRLSYRDSRFKTEPHLIILRVGLLLKSTGAPNISYKDLALYASTHTLQTPAQVGEAVRDIRSRKFPDLKTHGTAGSFFKNPLISPADYEALKKRFADLPGFVAGENIKVSLAWLLDNALSLRGFRLGHVRLFERQPLVIVSEAGASAQEVDALADTVARHVHEATGIVIEREVRRLPEK